MTIYHFIKPYKFSVSLRLPKRTLNIKYFFTNLILSLITVLTSFILKPIWFSWQLKHLWQTRNNDFKCIFLSFSFSNVKTKCLSKKNSRCVYSARNVTQLSDIGQSNLLVLQVFARLCWRRLIYLREMASPYIMR